MIIDRQPKHMLKRNKNKEKKMRDARAAFRLERKRKRKDKQCTTYRKANKLQNDNNK